MMSEPSSPDRKKAMTDDLDARIERWRTWGGRGSIRAYELDLGPHLTEAFEIMLALRDEVAQQRAAVIDLTRANMTFLNALAERRNEALEEAALACMGSGAIGREAWLCAAAIRGLKAGS